MNEYIATFYTHFAALSSLRAMDASGAGGRLMPVPRALSSSCGTALSYSADTPLLELLHADTEAVYTTAPGESYELIKRFE